MSTTGHYTRYINQYPGWSDGGDLMVYHIFIDGVKFGYLRVEHNKENTISDCLFDYGPGMSMRKRIYEYTGKNAIQNVLEYVKNNKENIICKLQETLQ